MTANSLPGSLIGIDVRRVRSGPRSTAAGRDSDRRSLSADETARTRPVGLVGLLVLTLALTIALAVGAGGGGIEVGISEPEPEANSDSDAVADAPAALESAAPLRPEQSESAPLDASGDPGDAGHPSSQVSRTSAPRTDSAIRAATSDIPIGAPEDDDVVVRLADDHVVTAAIADRLPSDPFVTVTVGEEEAEERLVVNDDGRLVTADSGLEATVEGKPVVQIGSDPDLVALGEGGSIRGTIVVDRSSGKLVTDGGEYTVKVGNHPITYDAYDETDVVPEILHVSEVHAGDTLQVETEFTNSEWGEGPVEAELQLRSPGEVKTASESVAIGPGEQTTDTLTYVTELDDTDVNEIAVVVDGNGDTRSHRIGDAGAAVSIVDTNHPIEGDNLTVTAEITRYGQVPSGAQDYPIDFSVNGTEIETEVVTLAPGETTTETFAYETDRDDVPRVEAAVASPSASDSAEVDVVLRMAHEHNIRSEITDVALPGADGGSEGTRTDANETDGEQGDGNETDDSRTGRSDALEVTASFWYDGPIPGNETEFPAVFTVDGRVAENRTVALDRNQSRVEATFTHAFNESDPPLRNATLETPGDVHPVGFDHDVAIAFEDVTDPAARNEKLTAVVTVENRGDTPGREPLTVAVDNPYAVESDGTRVSSAYLEPSESFSEDVTFNLTDDAPPRLELRANTTTAVETTSVEVRDNEPRFEIETAAVEEPAGPDENYTVTTTVRNAGGVAGTQDVHLRFDGETVHTESVTLDPDEERTVSAELEDVDDGTYAYGATTDDDSVSETADVASRSSGFGAGALVDRVAGAASLDALAMPLLALTALGLVAAGAVVIKQRADPDDIPVEIPDEISDEIHHRMAALQPAARRLQTAARNLVSNDGTGTVIVQNNLPRKALVRVRVRSGDEIVFLEDFELAEDERRTLECLPGGDGFAVGSGVDDIAAHEETFDAGTSDVGVILQPEGITINEL